MDLNNNLQTQPLNTGLAGIRIRHELGNSTFAEIGFLFKPYFQAFTFDNIPVSGSVYSFNSVLAPLKLGYRLKWLGSII